VVGRGNPSPAAHVKTMGLFGLMGITYDENETQMVQM